MVPGPILEMLNFKLLFNMPSLIRAFCGIVKTCSGVIVRKKFWYIFICFIHHPKLM